MLDTLFSKHSEGYLMSRFLSLDLKKWAVLDGDRVIFKNIVKANYNDFKAHCIDKPCDGKIKAILHANINIMGVKNELHQYVIWQIPSADLLAATLLSGEENFKIGE